MGRHFRRPHGVFAVSSRAIRDLPYALPLAAVLAVLSWLAAPAASPETAAAVESLSVPATPAAQPRDVSPQAQATVQAAAGAAGATGAVEPCQSQDSRNPAGSDQARAAGP